MPPWLERPPLFNKRLSSLCKKELQSLASHLGLDQDGTVAALKARARQTLLGDIRFYMQHPDYRALFTRQELADIIEEASNSSGSPFHGITQGAEAARDENQPDEGDEQVDPEQENRVRDESSSREEEDDEEDAQPPPPSDDLDDHMVVDDSLPSCICNKVARLPRPHPCPQPLLGAATSPLKGTVRCTRPGGAPAVQGRNPMGNRPGITTGSGLASVHPPGGAALTARPQRGREDDATLLPGHTTERRAMRKRARDPALGDDTPGPRHPQVVFEEPIVRVLIVHPSVEDDARTSPRPAQKSLAESALEVRAAHTPWLDSPDPTPCPQPLLGAATSPLKGTVRCTRPGGAPAVQGRNPMGNRPGITTGSGLASVHPPGGAALTARPQRGREDDATLLPGHTTERRAMRKRARDPALGDDTPGPRHPQVVFEEPIVRVLIVHPSVEDDARTSPRPAQKSLAESALEAKADCYSIPDPIRKKFQEGWTTHIPLNYLTDKAVAEYGCDTSSLLTDMYAVDPARGLIQAEKVLPSAGELKLSFGEWHQAWKRLLQLIKAYFPRDYERWKKHFRRICCTDGATSENWTLWLAYDAEVRRRCHLEGIDPGTFHKNIWNKVEPAHIKAQVMASLQPFRAQTASRSSGARPEQSSRHASGRAQLSSPKPIDSKCFFCGGKGHKASACKADRLINGQPVRLTRGEDRSVKDDKGRQYCFYFNMAGGCTKKDAGPCAKGDHRCTLCGGTNHGAQLCTVVC
ncbi:hypothetical protein PUNSTDRAFT_134282 [Punctularia strigosozonata HHB-11173 SS5]|uniref:uncharacterized protein n=1 Tax=Punctularia strigosozonata (strain HHB-11173) TaxID=741275 RepID=UPI00044174A1|nr:uncharacterized protein PUNSTDRAFT_134282 [Punctularia strigosozonata HHB-11173 SS5]EIN09116.1 hypothetical protein PUNSTDRAFT_134282 [Punctularia strigosozonata HHB-11173 SS5]